MTMHLRLWTTCLFISAVACGQVHGKGTYTVIAPNVVRPEVPYHVAISTQGVQESTDVIVGISGTQNSGGTVQASQEVTVQPDATSIVRLQLASAGSGTYNLTVRGVRGGLIFYNTTTLEFERKSRSVLIQTDKAIYKPGQTVRFRVITVDPNLRPSVTAPLDIFLKDGEGNRVKQWPRTFPQKGVFSGELELSEHPVLGDWTLVVQEHGQQAVEKSFEVAEYVLPKFQVLIHLPPYASRDQPKLPVTVEAKYTYGESVKGEVTLAVYPLYHSTYLQPVFNEPFRKVVPLNGNTTIEVDVVNDLKVSPDYERQIRFDAYVRESLTGRRQNVSATLPFYLYPHKLELIKSSDTFKPGLPYKAILKIAYQDDKPVIDSTGKVTVSHGFSYDPERYTSVEYPIPTNGILDLTFPTPKEGEAHVLGIEAKYKGLNQWFSTVDRALSTSDTFLQVSIQTRRPTAKRDVVVDVTSTAPMYRYTYNLLGRGDLLASRTVQANGAKSSSFTVQLPAAAAPKARIVVFLVRDDGEVVADVIDFDVEDTFQNFVDVVIRPKDVEPGAEVDLLISAKPNSFVGLLGVDQSVLLLKTGNDITQNEIYKELEDYDTGNKDPMYQSWLRDTKKKRSLVWWPARSATAGDVFDNAGVVIMTNADVYRKSVWGENATHPSAMNRPAHRPIPPKGIPVLRPDVGPAVPYARPTRPPLEGPYAFSRLPRPADERRKIYLVKDLPPTWLFDNVTIGYDGRTSLRKTAPDTMTSWVVTAFSLNSLDGLGVSSSPSKLRVFRPFFVSLNLPASVVRGEVVAIQIIVFNYMPGDLTARVTIHNTGGFDFADMTNEVNYQPASDESRTESVAVGSMDGTAISFLVVPKQLGYIDIKVSATSARAGDSILRKLLVKPEGSAVENNTAILVDLRNTRNISSIVDVTVPPNAVPGSARITVSSIGDILGPSIDNLDNLIKMPFGCGEQNMLLFVPNIVISNYLKSVGQLTDEIRGKSVKYMEIGYQKELTYKRNDGSFSAFGQSDNSGSTWLTAFVVRSFHQARPFITVDSEVISKALLWLVAQQTENGAFPEVGKVSHRAMQGGAANGVALTAYTLITLLEDAAQPQDRDTSVQSKLRNAQNFALDYIVKQLSSLDEFTSTSEKGAEDTTYALAIVCYALHLAQHPAKDRAFHLLESKANISATGDKKWWTSSAIVDDPDNLWHEKLPSPFNVETTAYAMLTYLRRNLVRDALPIVRWMVEQRNANGGFASTQDTVVGLTALAELGRQLAGGDSQMQVMFKYDGGSHTMDINRINAMQLQKYELPSDAREVRVDAVGRGVAIVQVSLVYNVQVVGAWPLFSVDPKLDKTATENHLKLSICTSFESRTTNSSNMAVMEVALPSGYTIDEDSVPSLSQSYGIKRVDQSESGTGLVLYFDELTRKEVCPTISAYRVHKVANQKPAAVLVYDYYDTSRRARSFYSPVKATLCDVCEGSDCSRRCVGPKSRANVADINTDNSRTVADSDSAITIQLYVLTTFVLAAMVQLF